jgi:hypothetical protein
MRRSQLHTAAATAARFDGLLRGAIAPDQPTNQHLPTWCLMPCSVSIADTTSDFSTDVVPTSTGRPSAWMRAISVTTAVHLYFSSLGGCGWMDGLGGLGGWVSTGLVGAAT